MTTLEKIRDINQTDKQDWKTRLSEAQNHRCCYCHEPFAGVHPSRSSATVEHVIPKSRGGSDDFTNLVLACRGCNLIRGSKISAEDFTQLIQLVKTPTEESHLVAIKHTGQLIAYIKKPSEAVQLAAVKQNGNAIQFIKNPSEKVQLTAVQQNKGAIRYIKNPAEMVKFISGLRRVRRHHQF